MSLVNSHLWAAIAPYVAVEVYDRDGGHRHPRVRFEVRGDPAVIAGLSKLTMDCVSCGQAVHPIRVRAPRPGGLNHYYLAVTCPLQVRMGCARSGAARDEYTRIREALCPDLGSP